VVRTEEADAALQAAMASEDLESIVSALTLHCEQASDGSLAEARATRNKLRNKAKKAQKQQRQLHQAEAAAANLIPAIHEASDVVMLETVLAEAQKWAGLIPALDEEIFVGQERLLQLRIETQAARKTATIEEHLEHYESVQVEHAQGEAGDDNAAASDADNSGGDVEGLCVVCIDADMTQLLFPCGHQCVCLACAETLEGSTKECPVCRAVFMGFCTVYKC